MMACIEAKGTDVKTNKKHVGTTTVEISAFHYTAYTAKVLGNNNQSNDDDKS